MLAGDRAVAATPGNDSRQTDNPRFGMREPVAKGMAKGESALRLHLAASLPLPSHEMMPSHEINIRAVHSGTRQCGARIGSSKAGAIFGLRPAFRHALDRSSDLSKAWRYGFAGRVGVQTPR